MKLRNLLIPCLSLLFCTPCPSAFPAPPPPDLDVTPAVSAEKTTGTVPGPGEAVPGSPPDPVNRASFRIAIRSTLRLSIPGEGPSVVKADAHFCYTWERLGSERTLTLDSMQVRAIAGGTLNTDTFVGPDRWIDRKSGDDLGPAKMPDALRELLRSSFGVKCYTVGLDEAGNVISTKRLLPEGSSPLINAGIVANALFFHVRFPPGQDRWEVRNALCGAGDTLASGLLTYVKGPTVKGHLVPVRDSGTLSMGARKMEGQPDVTASATDEVSGEQVYDLDLGEWVSGDLDLKINLSMDHRELARKATGEGTLKVSLEKLPRPQTGPVPWPAD